MDVREKKYLLPLVFFLDEQELPSSASGYGDVLAFAELGRAWILSAVPVVYSNDKIGTRGA